MRLMVQNPSPAETGILGPMASGIPTASPLPEPMSVAAALLASGEQQEVEQDEESRFPADVG